MERWQKILQDSVTDANKIADRFDIPVEEVSRVSAHFNMRITPYYLSLIKEKGDPIYRQVIPDIQELDNHNLFDDPLAEDNNSPVPSIVHRYSDRCLFLVSHVCASYCRFCTRKRKVGNCDKIRQEDIKEGIEYIRSHPEIRDVLLSGGDPFLLDDGKIDSILSQLRRIDHVEIIRIGTRVPCFLPQRITDRLVKMLHKYHPLYINVHFNHPDELTSVAMMALARLADAGIPLGNQTVLLKGVNDNPVTMKRLMQKLLMARVKPYYIYQADMVVGTEHFRTTVQEGLNIIQSLRGWTSGLAVPHFVIDAPNGGGKIPLLPKYLLSITDENVVLQNYKGNLYYYQQREKEKVRISDQHMGVSTPL